MAKADGQSSRTMPSVSCSPKGQAGVGRIAGVPGTLTPSTSVWKRVPSVITAKPGTVACNAATPA
jgi:hypothetical protein